MKRIRRVIAFFVVIAMLGAFTLPTYAFFQNTYCVSDLLKEKTVDGKRVMHLDGTDIHLLKASTAYATDAEKIAEIFHALGYADSVIDQLTENSAINSLDEIQSIQSTTSFLKENYLTNQQFVLSETECLQELSQLEPVNDDTIYYATSKNQTHENTPVADATGYMKITISAIHTPNYGGKNTVGRYMFLVGCEWLRMPITRIQDCISLSGTAFTWPGKVVDGVENYMLVSSYTMTSRDGTTGVTSNTPVLKEKGASAANMNANIGVYYKVDMPPMGWASNGNFVTYKDFNVALMATARLFDYNKRNQEPGVVVNYSHVRAAIKTDFTIGWHQDSKDDKGLKAKIAVSLTTKTVNYSDALSWDYALDF